MKTNSHIPRPIIKSNRPVAILLKDEYDSLIETMEVLSNRKVLSRIESALKNITHGRFFTHQQVFASRK